MSENNAPMKLKLKSTDTNKFRVVNEDAAKTPPAGEKAPDAGAAATQQVVDPISLRDTATGRLRKISENQDAVAAAPITMDASPSVKTQTVRLKVVRQDSKAAGPQTLRPTLGTTGAQKLGLRKDEGTPVLNPDENTGTPKLQLKKDDNEKSPAAPEPQNVQTPAVAPLKQNTPAEAPAPAATQSVQAPKTAATLKISLAKPANEATPAAEPITLKTAGTPATTPSPAATQSVAAPAPMPATSAVSAGQSASPSATVKLALPKMPGKPTVAKPAAPAAAATPATPAAATPATPAAPTAAIPVVKPAAAPQAAVPSLKKPAVNTNAVTPTLKKPAEVPPEPAAAPTPAESDNEASAEVEDAEVVATGVSKWVSISTIVACAALVGTIVYQVLIALKMLK